MPHTVKLSDFKDTVITRELAGSFGVDGKKSLQFIFYIGSDDFHYSVLLNSFTLCASNSLEKAIEMYNSII
jgi:hypothetical protein